MTEISKPAQGPEAGAKPAEVATSAQAPKPEIPTKTVKEFFEAVAPGSWVKVAELVERRRAGGGFNEWEMKLPDLDLHCDSERCGGVRGFIATGNEYGKPNELKEHFASFRCRNCGERVKTYAFWSRVSKDEVSGTLYKFGEVPGFGPPTPRRVLAILGDEKEYFLKGRRAENQSMGIAAFAYYRRVVENQKVKIFEEIIRVSTKLGAPKDMLGDLEAGKKERQFSKAVDTVKHGIPDALRINGHNPLTLLHNALSEGLHAQTDAECLELARSIRVVLGELVERMGSALKEEAELSSAVARLLQVKASKAQ